MDHPPHEFGAAVRRRRLDIGLSLAQLAGKVHYSRGHLSKIETGKRIPSPQLASLIDTALKAGGEIAGLLDNDTDGDDLDCYCDLPIDQGEAAIGNVDLPPDLAGATAVHGDAIAIAFEHSLVQVRKLGQTTSPGAIFPILDGSLRSLRALLNNTSGPGRPRLLMVAARYAEYFGWMKQEGGSDAEALAWTVRAVRLSKDSGNPDMHAYSLVRQALIRLYRGDGPGTVGLALQAQADQQIPARILGLAALREGQGHALNRDYERFRDAMTRAAELLKAPGREPTDALYGSYTVGDPAKTAEGWSLYHLGRPADGAAILAQELPRLPRYAARSYGRYAARCALQFVVCGELDRACVIVEELLPRITDVVSATILSDLRELSRQLARRREDRRVRGLLPDLTAAIHHQSSMIGATANE
ncbi:helix-turn-helix domain-containing protein [Glycomyces sp. L485]|uniref:helix-turn-helix domain-containing protein n=1 Tax=Glycomyces sp. L485 TaxID=2909235 RepID=UPI001F4A31D2|nr:helix-turn-helix transcriptional regulator [Glycomyces sp. L485]MCH7231051.1 helix-turn-helix domain-containing protein [Glycomyces sp. L485]